MQNKKILILFGAGASKGCLGIKSPPPLGDELFNDLCVRFPTTWNLLSQDVTFKKKFERNFEEGMEWLYETRKDKLAFLWDMTMFFAGFKFDNLKSSLYFKLIERYQRALLDQTIILSTLNYECLLEYAIIPFCLPIYRGDEKGIKLLKPHGACNFKTEGVTVARAASIDPQSFSINVPISFLHPDKVVEHFTNNQLPAAMCLYMRGKKSIIAPDQIELIASEFKQLLISADTVVVIGVRPNPEDTHIWDNLRMREGNLFMIAGEEECEKWNDEHRQGKHFDWISNRFQAGFEKLCSVLDEAVHEVSKGIPFVRTVSKIGRNEPCWCGNGMKYKKCHGLLV